MKKLSMIAAAIGLFIVTAVAANADSGNWNSHPIQRANRQEFRSAVANRRAHYEFNRGHFRVASRLERRSRTLDRRADRTFANHGIRNGY